MFEWIFRKKDGSIQNILDIITAELNKVQLARLAEEKAQNMIANAIARSPIVLKDAEGIRKNVWDYRLNVRPNPNQSATQFWYNVYKDYLRTGESLVVMVGDRFYRAKTWECSNYVMFGKTYRNVTITDGVDETRLDMIFPADKVMRFAINETRQRSRLIRAVLESYNKVFEAVSTMVQLSASPTFKYKTGATTTFKDKATGKILTIDIVIARMTEKLKESGIKIIPENDGTSLEYMEYKSTITAEHMKKLKDDINELAALSYDIPLTVFNGTVTEKSDAVSDFVTFACMPIVRMAQDVMNGILVGEKDYLKGERITVQIAGFMYINLFKNAQAASALRAIGITLDEILEMAGFPAINSEFSTTRALTLNYAAEGKEEGDGDGRSDDPADEPRKSNSKQSKHAERRKKRYAET